MARFKCDGCGHTQLVKDSYVGRTTKCPRCQTPGKVVAYDEEFNVDFLEEPVGIISEFGDPDATTCTSSGGSMRLSLGHNIVMNEESSLDREWITISDPKLPARIVGSVGIKALYRQQSDYRVGGYYYKATYEVRLIDDVRAIETKFLTFDVWGSHNRTLVATEVTDLKAGTTRKFEGEWDEFSENDVRVYYASIAYISRVRTRDGRVIAADIAPVMDAARRFSDRFSEEDLDRKESRGA
jgi:hypothetical protein